MWKLEAGQPYGAIRSGIVQMIAHNCPRRFNFLTNLPRRQYDEVRSHLLVWSPGTPPLLALAASTDRGVVIRVEQAAPFRPESRGQPSRSTLTLASIPPGHTLVARSLGRGW